MQYAEEIDDGHGGIGGIIQLKPEITFNNTRVDKDGRKAPDGIEIRFGSARPTPEVRDILKAHGFRFSERQTMWYAKDNSKSRALVEMFSKDEVDADDTKYEKLNFWARIKNVNDYDALREKTEFVVISEPPKYFYSKRSLEMAFRPAQVIRDPGLKFKKYYNRVIDDTSSSGDVPEPSGSSQQSNADIAGRLYALAESMQKEIDRNFNPAISRQRPTPRRARIAAGMAKVGSTLKRIQSCAFQLAEAHANGRIEVFPLLAKIRRRSDIELILKRELTNARFGDDSNSLSKLGINSDSDWRDAFDQLTELIADGGSSGENERVAKIRELEARIVQSDIPGYFPTPPDLIERILHLADIREGNSVLEPSAGRGDILDAIRKTSGHAVLIDVIEPNPLLRELLTVKGYSLVGSDFLDFNMPGKYDQVVMNPPFENGQDVEHVRHAFTQLKPSGRLVAVVSEGPFFRSFKRDIAFREWLEENNAYISEPIKDAFRKSANPTGVSVRIVAIDAGGTPIFPKDRYKSANDDLATLELEAEAELELLKMRVQAARRNAVGGGFGNVPFDMEKLQRMRQQAWAMQNLVDVINYH